MSKKSELIFNDYIIFDNGVIREKSLDQLVEVDFSVESSPCIKIAFKKGSAGSLQLVYEKMKATTIDIVLEEGANWNIFETHTDGNEGNIRQIILKSDAKLNMFVMTANDTMQNEQEYDLHERSELIVNYGQFDAAEVFEKCKVNLLGVGASARLYVGAFVASGQTKKIGININHKAKNTVSDVKCYGIAGGVLHFDNETLVEKNISGCVLKQKGNVIVLDKDGSKDVRIEPILKINDNDVIASHGATIGQINPEHLFYLQSRGISVEDARKIIMHGYLYPLIDNMPFEGTLEVLQSFIDKLVF